jgi:branched-subunit amino acid transport protein AzlD
MVFRLLPRLLPATFLIALSIPLASQTTYDARGEGCRSLLVAAPQTSTHTSRKALYLSIAATLELDTAACGEPRYG